MDERVVKNLVARLNLIERRMTRLRFGRISDLDPLSVKLGDAPDPYTDVRSLVPPVDGQNPTGLRPADYVAVLVSGNDLLILGKVI